MFETLNKAPGDKIFALMAEYRADNRPEKIDLGIGVYKNEAGKTPILTSVKTAEKRLFESETTKSYVGVAGNKAFNNAVVDLVFAQSVDRARIAAVQSLGGTGSLWVLMQLINRARPGGRIFISDPTWPNHLPLADGAGLSRHTYPYFDPKTRQVDFDAMLATLDGLTADDTVLLHACCHNPTGANLTEAQWDAVAASLKKTGALPLLDLAYLGFGDGLEADAYAPRVLARELPELLLAFSASKNFGLYRERAGVAIAITRDADAAAITQSNLSNITRSSYSQSPDHGAEIVNIILGDPELRAQWEAELAQMRTRMVSLREKLAEAIREKSNATDFDFVANHRGMFSLLGLSREAVDHLKDKNAIYMIDDSRINVAGIPEDRVGELADALLSVVR